MRDKCSVVKKSRCGYKCLDFGHVRAECKTKYCFRVCQSDDHHSLLFMNDKPRCNNDTGSENYFRFNQFKVFNFDSTNNTTPTSAYVKKESNFFYVSLLISLTLM